MFILEATSACGIPTDIVNVISTVIKAIKIVVPVILIIVGMIEMGKAITHQKEDEIKKAQSSLIKKAIIALIVFLMPALVSWVFSLVSSGEGTDSWKCVQEVLNGVDENAGQTEKVYTANDCAAEEEKCGETKTNKVPSDDGKSCICPK